MIYHLINRDFVVRYFREVACGSRFPKLIKYSKGRATLIRHGPIRREGGLDILK